MKMCTFVLTIPSPALSVAGSKGMFSAKQMRSHPLLPQKSMTKVQIKLHLPKNIRRFLQIP